MVLGQGLWDPVIGRVARRFLDRLSPENREECEAVILVELCRNPQPEDNPTRFHASYFPHAPGIIECAIGRWYFRYRLMNANALEVITVYFAPGTDDYPPLLLS